MQFDWTDATRHSALGSGSGVGTTICAPRNSDDLQGIRRTFGVVVRMLSCRFVSFFKKTEDKIVNFCVLLRIFYESFCRTSKWCWCFREKHKEALRCYEEALAEFSKTQSHTRTGGSNTAEEEQEDEEFLNVCKSGMARMLLRTGDLQRFAAIFIVIRINKN